ncbi:hypothetical protein FOA52_008099 [Chlamydomonas sp. UWO 241]|nr:hypothetical protein FOA52_008099 [Chlamydomonas sp. UWO 241]
MNTLSWCQDLLQPDQASKARTPRWVARLCGLLLLAAALIVVAASTWVVVLHALPPSQHALVRAVQDDWYYCCLVPLALPVLLFGSGVQWFSLKLFKHNS